MRRRSRTAAISLPEPSRPATPRSRPGSTKSTPSDEVPARFSTRRATPSAARRLLAADGVADAVSRFRARWRDRARRAPRRSSTRPRRHRPFGRLGARPPGSDLRAPRSCRGRRTAPRCRRPRPGGRDRRGRPSRVSGRNTVGSSSTSTPSDSPRPSRKARRSSAARTIASSACSVAELADYGAGVDVRRRSSRRPPPLARRSPRQLIGLRRPVAAAAARRPTKRFSTTRQPGREPEVLEDEAQADLSESRSSRQRAAGPRSPRHSSSAPALRHVVSRRGS